MRQMRTRYRKVFASLSESADVAGDQSHAGSLRENCAVARFACDRNSDKSRYKAKNDVIELNVDYAMNGTDLSLASQTGYNQDFLSSTEDYNRFDTSHGFFRGTSTGELCDSGGRLFAILSSVVQRRLVAQDLSEERAWQLSQEIRLTDKFSMGHSTLVWAETICTMKRKRTITSSSTDFPPLRMQAVVRSWDSHPISRRQFSMPAQNQQQRPGGLGLPKQQPSDRWRGTNQKLPLR